MKITSARDLSRHAAQEASGFERRAATRSAGGSDARAGRGLAIVTFPARNYACGMGLYLGLDSSTQSLSALFIDTE